MITIDHVPYGSIHPEPIRLDSSLVLIGGRVNEAHFFVTNMNCWSGLYHRLSHEGKHLCIRTARISGTWSIGHAIGVIVKL